MIVRAFSGQPKPEPNGIPRTELGAFTIAELAHYEGKKRGAQTAKFRRWLMARRRDIGMFKGSNGRWMVHLDDYQHYHRNFLTFMWRKAQGELLKGMARQVPEFWRFRTKRTYRLGFRLKASA